MNCAANAVTDSHMIMRPWRTRLHEVLTQGNERFVEFLEKPAEEWPAVARHNEFIKALETPSFNSSASWLRTHVRQVVDDDEVLNEITEDLGRPIEDIHKDVCTILDRYISTIQSLFRCNDAMHKKLTMLESLQTHVQGFMNLEGEGSECSQAMVSLQESILQYVRSRYETLDVQNDYLEFCKMYARFQSYRSVLSIIQNATDVGRTGGPICTICMYGTITTALTPCGHVFCNSCAQKQRTQCYLCRNAVQDRLRIYFS